jgi:hypothetical protein
MCVCLFLFPSIYLSLSLSLSLFLTHTLSFPSILYCFSILGFLALLLEKISAISESLSVGLERVLEPRLLLALASHTCIATRTLVVRIIDALLRLRASTFVRAFLSAQGFLVLASQLRQHTVSDDLFIAACDMTTGQSVCEPLFVFPPVNFL